MDWYIHSSFDTNFNYWPLICTFTSKASLSKLENIQKCAFRFALDGYQPGYTDLQLNAVVPRIKIMVLRNLAIEVFKCLNEISPAYPKAMITRKECPYALRDYKNPLHLDVVDRYLRRMGDKTIPDEAPPSLVSFYPPWVVGIDLPQSRCCGFFVSFTNKHE